MTSFSSVAVCGSCGNCCLWEWKDPIPLVLFKTLLGRLAKWPWMGVSFDVELVLLQCEGSTATTREWCFVPASDSRIVWAAPMPPKLLHKTKDSWLFLYWHWGQNCIPEALLSKQRGSDSMLTLTFGPFLVLFGKGALFNSEFQFCCQMDFPCSIQSIHVYVERLVHIDAMKMN